MQYFWILSFVLLANDVKAQDDKCPKTNQMWAECPVCDLTCVNMYLDQPCTVKACFEGCGCMEGFVRDPKTNECITPFNCDPNEIECPPLQELNTCASLCGSASCMDGFYTGRPLLMCPAVCVTRCQCIKDYTFDNINGKGCVLVKDCPKTITCTRGRIYEECGTKCPKSCSDPNPACEKICVKGCFCPEGLIEDNKGNCIPPEYCPLKCGWSEIEDPCANACQPTCNEPVRGYCPTLSCNKGCVCSPPLVRDESTGQCVDFRNCPVQCKIEGQQYYDCGSCPLTCDNYKTDIACAEKCYKGCQCKPGTVLDSKRNKCIPSEFCTCPVAA